MMSSIGNLGLRSEYTDNFEVGYLQRIGKNSISGNVFYRHIKDNIFRNVDLFEKVSLMNIKGFDNQ